MINTKTLVETDYFDFSHPAIEKLVSNLSGASPREKVIDAYYKIRDGIAYNPYTFVKGPEALKASFAASQDSAFCIPKSALLVAVCRALGVAAKIGFADVKNHLSSPKLLAWLKSDLFVMHGYASIFLDGKWVKCTPVFDRALCEKMGIAPLEFDGETDSIFHAFTNDGEKHMEYVTDHGCFTDMPVDFIYAAAINAYPHLMSTSQLDEVLPDSLASDLG